MVKNVGIYLVKRRQRGREGVIKSGKWADVVYGYLGPCCNMELLVCYNYLPGLLNTNKNWKEKQNSRQALRMFICINKK